MLSYILDATPSFAGDHGFYQTLLMMMTAIVFFYIVLWRPEQKRKRSLDVMRKNLSKGDKVIAMGMVGTIEEVNGDSLLLKQKNGTELEILRNAVSEVKKP